MNLKNLVMWAVIVFLTIGLYNMFKNPNASMGKKNTIIFSEFLSEVDNGRVVKVEIQGNNISGVLSDGNTFITYSPNDPNLIEKIKLDKINTKATLGGCFVEKINKTVLISREKSSKTKIL